MRLLWWVRRYTCIARAHTNLQNVHGLRFTLALKRARTHTYTNARKYGALTHTNTKPHVTRTGGKAFLVWLWCYVCRRVACAQSVAGGSRVEPRAGSVTRTNREPTKNTKIRQDGAAGHVTTEFCDVAGAEDGSEQAGAAGRLALFAAATSRLRKFGTREEGWTGKIENRRRRSLDGRHERDNNCSLYEPLTTACIDHTVIRYPRNGYDLSQLWSGPETSRFVQLSQTKSLFLVKKAWSAFEFCLGPNEKFTRKNKKKKTSNY